MVLQLAVQWNERPYLLLYPTDPACSLARGADCWAFQCTAFQRSTNRCMLLLHRSITSVVHCMLLMSVSLLYLHPAIILSKGGRRPLYDAIKGGDLRRVKQLLAAGASPSSVVDTNVGHGPGGLALAGAYRCLPRCMCSVDGRPSGGRAA
jgi:hypothetical protein